MCYLHPINFEDKNIVEERRRRRKDNDSAYDQKVQFCLTLAKRRKKRKTGNKIPTQNEKDNDGEYILTAYDSGSGQQKEERIMQQPINDFLETVRNISTLIQKAYICRQCILWKYGRRKDRERK